MSIREVKINQQKSKRKGQATFLNRIMPEIFNKFPWAGSTTLIRLGNISSSFAVHYGIIKELKWLLQCEIWWSELYSDWDCQFLVIKLTVHENNTYLRNENFSVNRVNVLNRAWQINLLNINCISMWKYTWSANQITRSLDSG